MIGTYLKRLARTTLFAAACAAIAPTIAHAVGFNATLEGQSRSLLGADATLPAGQGKGDGIWTTGGLSNWREGDWVPVRVNLTGGPVSNQPIVVQFDYGSGSNLGEEGAFTYVAAPIPSSSPYPAGFRPDAIPTSNLLDDARGLQGTGTVSVVHFVSVSPVTGTSTTTLSYTFNVTMTGATGTVQFMSRLASGSHNFGGSSLQIKGSPSLGTLGIFKPSAAPGNPDLTVAKSGPSTAGPGQTVTYTLNYSNIAPKTSTAGTGVQVVDTLPTGLTYVAGSATCTSCIGVNSEPAIISNTLTWDVANVQPGATASPTPAAGSTGTITFKATVDPAATNGTALINAAQIYCAEDDVNHANDSSTVTTTVSVSATNLAVNPASGTYGGTASLSATLTIGGTITPLVGRTISFSLNGNSVCGGAGQQACPTTDATGTATLSNVYLTTNGLSTGGVAIDANTYPTGVSANYAGETGPPKYDASSGQASLTISKATLVPGTGNGTTSIKGYSVTYDGNAHTATGVATGVLAEDLSNLLDLSATTHTDAASYPTDAWSFAGNANYNAASGTVSDNISKATLVPGTGNGTISITGYDVTYDANPHTATGKATGIKGEDLSSLLDLGATTHTAAASYATDAWSFAGDSNYNSASGIVADQIGGKALHVTATGINRVYDGTTVATVTLSNDAVSGDTVAAAYTGASFADKNVGTGKPVSVTGISIAGGAQAGNYTLSNTATSAVADITQRPLTVTAQPDTKLYDGTLISSVLPKVTSGTIALGDTGNFTQSFSSKAAGKPVTLVPSGNVTDANSGANYAYTFVPINVPSGGITVRTLTPTVTAASKTYDGTTTATIATRTVSGVLTGETVDLTGGTATFSDPNAGTGKTVTAVNLTLSGADAGNYALSSTTASTTADIFKAAQSISFAPIQNQVFNVDPPLALSPTASSGLPVTLAVTSGSASVSGNIVTISGLGHVTLTASQPGDQNYNAADSVDQTFNVVPPPALLNISTRGRVGTKDNVLIGGYIIKGAEAKTFAARGIGPSLKEAGIAEVAADPVLELHGADGKLLVQDDNWQEDPTEAAEITAVGLAPKVPAEAALAETTAPGAYTAIVSDKAEANGTGLVELYDLSQNAAAVLANISSRAVAGTGDDVMVGGFIVNGKLGAAKVIMRAIGPSLGQAGVANTLPDPVLELRDNEGRLIASNDNWQDDPAQAAAIQDTTIPPGDPKEAAIVISLPPANYTFIVKDKNGATGVALAEVYDLTN